MMQKINAAELRDIAAILSVLSGSDGQDEPSGVVWLGSGSVDVVSDEGVIGRLVYDEDTGWLFEPFSQSVAA